MDADAHNGAAWFLLRGLEKTFKVSHVLRYIGHCLVTTLSLSCAWLGVALQCHGLSRVNFSSKLPLTESRNLVGVRLASLRTLYSQSAADRECVTIMFGTNSGCFCLPSIPGAT